MAAETEIKFYYDYKSPFAYLAFDPVMALSESHAVVVRPIPSEIDIQAAFGGETHERTERAWSKVRYIYRDARRFANERGLTILGPQKIFDSRLSAISGLYATANGFFVPYSRRVFEGFFRRELDIEDRAALEGAMAAVGGDPSGFRAYAEGQGQADYAKAVAEREADHVFGVPMMFVGEEPFWGYDRLGWVVRRLDALGLRRGADPERAAIRA